MIVDQVIPKMRSECEEDENLYLSIKGIFKPAVFGAVFNPRQGGGDNRIPFEGNQSSLSFFTFSTPFSEDEVVEYLRLQIDESTREEGVNISFANQLLESYEKYKESDRDSERDSEREMNEDSHVRLIIILD